MSKKTIELTDVVEEKPKKRGWKLRIFLKSVKYLVLLSIIVTASFVITLTTSEAFVWANTKTTEVKYSIAEKLDLIKYTTKIVPLRETEIDELIKAYCTKYGIKNTAIIYAMIDQESVNKNHKDRLRYEQGWKNDYTNKPGFEREAWMTDIEYDMLFTSIGLMQVGYGLHRKTCGLNSYSDLLNPAINLDCGIKLLASCLKERIGTKSQYQRVWLCFRDFNGSGPKAELYANQVMSRVSQHYIDDEQILKDDEVKKQEFAQKFPEIAEMTDVKSVQIEEPENESQRADKETKQIKETKRGKNSKKN